MVYFKTALRGLSVCTTCLLSVFQAIIISPTSSWLAKLKHLPSYYIIWHKRQSQYLHSTCLAPRVSPETKATQTILMLTVFI
ncbi:vomeronasal type-1 receptor 105-like [Rhynchocyon petersi]